MTIRTTVARSGVVLAAWVAAGCPNMDQQSNYRPLESAPQFADESVARPTPRHTVPRDEPAVAIQGGGRFPVAVTAELLRRGRERFEIYCAVCHGSDGYGDGIIVARGFPRPPSYHEPRLVNAPEQHFVDVMTHGYGVMYSYADRVNVRDRWAIAAYIRALQRSQRATLDDVPESERARLEEVSP